MGEDMKRIYHTDESESDWLSGNWFAGALWEWRWWLGLVAMALLSGGLACKL
jgi:hypothetical protein